MSARLVIGLLALAGTSISGIVSTVVHFEMVSMVNAMLSKEQQFEGLGWYLPKIQRLHRAVLNALSRWKPLTQVAHCGRRWAVSLLICA
jgi:hypothetical protein